MLLIKCNLVWYKNQTIDMNEVNKEKIEIYKFCLV